jgi:hypothetical protein
VHCCALHKDASFDAKSFPAMTLVLRRVVFCGVSESLLHLACVLPAMLLNIREPSECRFGT